jgi:hypothetical protein
MPCSVSKPEAGDLRGQDNNDRHVPGLDVLSVCKSGSTLGTIFISGWINLANLATCAHFLVNICDTIICFCLPRRCDVVMVPGLMQVPPRKVRG